MAPCDRCKEHGKTWIGDNPNCAFPNNGEFDPDNWNCAMANDIRELVYEGQEMPSGVDYQYCDDQKYATVNINEVGLGGDEPYIGLALWVSWYKSRGRTEAMWVLDYEEPPRRPTFAECKAIIAHYKEQGWVPA